MRKLILFSAFIFTAVILNAQVEKVSFSELEDRITNTTNDTVYVVNFWATWCAPCVHELPEFKKVQDDLSISNTKFIFVSLDFPGQEEKVAKLFDKQKLSGEVVMFTESDANEWIEKINSDWQGNIPVTWFLNPAKENTYFHKGTIEATEIQEQLIKLNK